MPSPKRIAGFFFRLLLFYAILAVPWPGVTTAYATLYRAAGNFAFESLVPGGRVRFQPIPPPLGKYDTHIHFINMQSKESGKILVSSRRMAYLQTVFFASLVLATPLPWRRRFWAMFWGLILVNVAVAGKVLFQVVYAFSGTTPSLFDSTPLWKALLMAAKLIPSGDAVILFMFPVIIWILVSFRWADWVRWVQGGGQPVATWQTSPRKAKR